MLIVSPVSLFMCSVEERPRAQPPLQVLAGRWYRRLGSYQEQTGSRPNHQRAATLHVAAHPAEVPAVVCVFAVSSACHIRSFSNVVFRHY